MAIKSLELFLFERGLVGSYPLEALKNSTLGIDVGHYVSRLLTAKKEQYLDAVGGFPTSLNLFLESDLKVFAEYNITPVFIFEGSLSQNNLIDSGHFVANGNVKSVNSMDQNNAPGATTNGRESNGTSDKDIALAHRNKAWTQWKNLVTATQSTYIDQPPIPHEPFRYHTSVDPRRYQEDLIQYFIEHEVHYQVAPFVAWSQLAYLYKHDYIDAIFGPTDCLMLGEVDRFILGMEFPNKDFRYIDKNRVLKEMGISLKEFVDIAMTLGNTLQPTTLPPLQIYPSNKLFEIALEMVLNTGTNFYLYQLGNEMDTTTQSYLEQFQRGVSHLKYMPVLKDSGKVDLYINDFENMNSHSDGNKLSQNGETENEHYNNKKSETTRTLPIPNDVHDFITQRLPNEYYFYKSLGLTSGKLFDAITTGVYPEEPPLDGGASNSYRKLVTDSVTIFKNKELNLLTQPINRYFQMKQIKQVKWFDNDDKTTLLNRTTPSIFDKLNHLIVKTGSGDENKSFAIDSFIKLLNDSTDLVTDFISNDVLFPNSVPLEKKLNNSFDLLATTLLRTLVQLEFFQYDFDKKILKPTPWGEIFLKFNNLQIEPQFQENLLILLLFLKTNVLTLSEEFQPSIHSALSDHTLRTYPQEANSILLLTRVLTLYQVKQKPTNYHGPIDKKTLAFRDHLDFVRENMNDMFEAVLVSSLTANEFNKLQYDNHNWQKDIVAKMPFKLELPNILMAMMWEFFLQKYLHNGNSKSDAMALINNVFNTYKMITKLEEQFDNSFKYLDQCSKLFKEVAGARLMKSNEATAFEDAVALCKNALVEN
ncbi:similar to Saccharomyces cerevisiae YNL085W MKT1 Protein that forms a complex with Pbp1p that may mediate posttranscriptional regulation of HO [Maudiozyma barnettii]|uniref:Similar to Saccharomyces cerevisiae YNL085W MKT1 Protein that forms a complex with Pbp1p that may mediate posttranscriptional regulation of HO n=1 Tax=Maudiozyma barnettii TaxID=61262 RepID=A0A8H2VE74_9SACH|nr:Mkt1p [Kazachstania barnettii]CAB4253261.1 similar to Saccharomyces cerevisiae YNL085W MKT1 Protein that forms a complex with Pbp1p that may mediate posttranscriptional regulation of HO [Kazachstania barnettii]CAD1780203.1 similar to Saccharomyces cerevisiae YNL085W MKT1 Protein that forms a complex with Pbp1p that may mediate posttranscriptional regulation of HO [Kazachstania barnettii]